MSANLTYLALAWLAGLMLATHAGIPIPDGFGLAVFGATLWALANLYIRLCRRFPAFGWIGLGFLAGVFGASRPVYVRNEITVDDEGNEVVVCDAAADDTYCDGGGSSDSTRRLRRLRAVEAAISRENEP